MKFKTTQKAIKANYNNIIKVGYCKLQHLLNHLNPIAYTCGVYGWKADIYEITPDTVVVTGYAPFGNISADYDTCKRFDTLAQKTMRSSDFENELNTLVPNFVNSLVEK